MAVLACSSFRFPTLLTYIWLAFGHWVTARGTPHNEVRTIPFSYRNPFSLSQVSTMVLPANLDNTYVQISTLIPDPIQLDRLKLGAMFIGTLISAVLYGLFLLPNISRASSYPLWLKTIRNVTRPGLWRPIPYTWSCHSWWVPNNTDTVTFCNSVRSHSVITNYKCVDFHLTRHGYSCSRSDPSKLAYVVW